MQLPELVSISPSLCFIQSSPCSPCSPRDSTSVSCSFSSRAETQEGQTNQDHSEKVLLNLEEVKVSGREIVIFVHQIGTDLLNVSDAAGQ